MLRSILLIGASIAGCFLLTGCIGEYHSEEVYYDRPYGDTVIVEEDYIDPYPYPYYYGGYYGGGHGHGGHRGGGHRR
jgi:hypothetical protein